MITSYEVGAVWKIVDQVTPTLTRIADQLRAFDKLVQGVHERLGQIGSQFTAISDTRFAGVNRGLTGISTRLENIERRANTAKSALGGIGGGMQMLPGSGGRGPGSSGGLGGGGPGGGARGALGHRDDNWAHVGLGLGMAGTLGLHEVADGFEKVLEKANELRHVQEQMNAAGMSAKEIAQATAAAWQESSKWGLSVSKVMDDIKELRLPLGTTAHAIDFIDPLEKMRVVLNSVSPGRGNESAEAVYKMARAGELKGLQNPEEFMSYFNGMTQAISASGGKITPNSFAQATQYGRMASFGWSEDFYTKSLPTLIQTMNPSGAGTALMSLYGTLAQGKVTKRALGSMQDLGLIGDPSKIILDGKGDPVGFNPGAVKGTQELIQNPLAWAKDVLTPLLEKKYGDVGDPANKEKILEALGGLFGNRTSAQAIAELALRSKSFDKDHALVTGAQGLGGADRLIAQDPTVVMEKFTNSWSNLLTALGASTVQPAIESMNTMSSGLNSISKWATDHPGFSQYFTAAMAGLAAGLAVLTATGVVAAMVLFLPGGAITLGFAGLAAVLTSISVLNWDSLTRFASWVGGLVSLFKGTDVGGTSQRFQQDRQNLNPLFKHSAYTEGSNDNDPGIQMVRRGVLLAFQDYAGGAGGAAVAGGSGFINAAYTTFGDTAAAGAAPGRSKGAIPGANGIGGNGFFSAGAPGSAVDVASSMLGMHEIGNRAAVNKFLNEHGSHIDAARTAWCAAFVNAALDAVGIKGTGSLAASSFMNWGKRVGLNDLHKGDVLVKNHHVGIFSGYGPHGEIGMISGNHGNAVGHSWEAPGGILGARRAMPSVGAPPRRDTEQTHIHNLHMDGKIVASVVTRRQTQRGMFPTSVGSLDAHGSFASPGTPFTDAA